ncbi:MAG: hypothetical protein ACP5OV_02430 [Acidimicrobiales bacterium]
MSTRDLARALARHAMVVPLKGFTEAKSRLRQEGLRDVEVLVRDLATSVIVSCDPHPTFVLTESDDVDQFARGRGWTVLRSPHRGLNATSQWAFGQLRKVFWRVTFVHGDIQHPAGIAHLPITADVMIVPDHHGVGTTILSLPASRMFHMRFGPGSAQAHAREAAAQGLSWAFLTSSPWSRDVDVPSDLLRDNGESEGGNPPSLSDWC